MNESFEQQLEHTLIDYIWGIFTEFLELFALAALIILLILFVYDRYIQRQHALLINYPVIGRMRYVLEAFREPLRQYFADETF